MKRTIKINVKDYDYDDDRNKTDANYQVRKFVFFVFLYY